MSSSISTPSGVSANVSGDILLSNLEKREGLETHYTDILLLVYMKRINHVIIDPCI